MLRSFVLTSIRTNRESRSEQFSRGGFEARRWRASHLNHRNDATGSRTATGPEAAVPALLPVGRNPSRPASQRSVGGTWDLDKLDQRQDPQAGKQHRSEAAVPASLPVGDHVERTRKPPSAATLRGSRQARSTARGFRGSALARLTPQPPWRTRPESREAAPTRVRRTRFAACRRPRRANPQVTVSGNAAGISTSSINGGPGCGAGPRPPYPPCCLSVLTRGGPQPTVSGRPEGSRQARSTAGPTGREATPTRAGSPVRPRGRRRRYGGRSTAGRRPSRACRRGACGRSRARPRRCAPSRSRGRRSAGGASRS